MDVGDVTAWASSVDTQAGLDGSGTHMDSPVYEAGSHAEVVLYSPVWQAVVIGVVHPTTRPGVSVGYRIAECAE